jgi:hypothetical protein
MSQSLIEIGDPQFWEDGPGPPTTTHYTKAKIRTGARRDDLRDHSPQSRDLGHPAANLAIQTLFCKFSLEPRKRDDAISGSVQ